jgi:hypothetical protein
VIGLVLLGLIATLSVAGVIAAGTITGPARDSLEQAQRASAISGRAVEIVHDSTATLVQPDGRIITDSSIELWPR